MTEKYVNSNGHLAKEFTNGAKLEIPGAHYFRAIYTKREYKIGEQSGFVYNKISPDGSVVKIAKYRSGAQVAEFDGNVFGFHRTLVADGETIVMEYHGLFTTRGRKSKIANEFAHAYALATGEERDPDDIRHPSDPFFIPLGDYEL